MFQFKSKVRYSEIDQKGNLNIVSLINYLQDCAAFHSESIGHGLYQLNDNSQGWYITSWQLKIHSLPGYASNITISTWPYDMKGMIAKRNFIVENEAKERLVSADSIWVLMNIEKGHPERIPDEAISAYNIEPPLSEEWKGRRIALFEKDSFFEAGKLTVEPVHLDTNHHMNNAYYVEIARDVLPKDKKIFGIRVEYKQPAVLGDTICVRMSEKDLCYQVLLENPEGKLFSAVEFETQP